jgi:hypothetical protein
MSFKIVVNSGIIEVNYVSVFEEKWRWYWLAYDGLSEFEFKVVLENYLGF